MLEKYKHISFDLDGTLVHTVPEYRHKVVQQVVSELDGKILSSRLIDKFWFEPGRDKIIQNDFQLDPTLFWNLFRKKDLIKSRATHTFAYKDAESALKELKVIGKKISIITGAPHKIAQMEIKKMNGVPYDFYLSLNENYKEKPHPMGMEIVLKELKCEPEETVYIGNSNEDMLFAENSGVDFIFLERKEHSFYSRKNFSIIHSLDELF